MDSQGHDITPKSHVETFTLRDNTQPYVSETIMTREEAKRYTLKRIFADWEPDKDLRKWEGQAKKLLKRLQ